MTTQEILEAARGAKTAVALSDSGTRDSALLGMADALCAPESMDAILAANAEDMAAAKGRISDVMLDRLALTPQRIEAMAKGIRDVAALPDPVGRVLSRIERPNGLVIEKTAVPMGVIAIIYESRPNVTSDAAALAIKSGNACILRCGKEAWRSANAIVTTLRQGLRANGLPETAVCLIEDTTHASANALMTAVGYVDLLIPRGGAGLIRACVENAKVPCIQTGTGICHIFVDDTADQTKALDIIENAKASRPSVCNAEEVCLVHSAIAREFLPKLAQRLGPDRTAKGLHPVELRLDERAAALIPGTPAGPKDFDTEFLDYILAVKVVDSVEEAIAHIAAHSTGHSEAILTQTDATLPSSRRQWTVPPSTSTAPPASPTAESSALAVRWASPPRSSTPGDPWASASCAAISTSSTATARPGNFRVFPGCITLSVKIFSTGRGQMPRPVFLFHRDGPFFSQAHFWLKNFCKYIRE